MCLLVLLYVGVIVLCWCVYCCGWCKCYLLLVLVIVVGNIMVGGIGKMLLIIVLVECLCVVGWKLGVVSRGYGCEDVDKLLWVWVDMLIVKGGDELVLIVWKIGVLVCVDSDWVVVGKVLIEVGCDVIVCDDGL